MISLQKMLWPMIQETVHDFTVTESANRIVKLIIFENSIYLQIISTKYQTLELTEILNILFQILSVPRTLHYYSKLKTNQMFHTYSRYKEG